MSWKPMPDGRRALGIHKDVVDDPQIAGQLEGIVRRGVSRLGQDHVTLDRRHIGTTNAAGRAGVDQEVRPTGRGPAGWSASRRCP